MSMTQTSGINFSNQLKVVLLAAVVAVAFTACGTLPNPGIDMQVAKTKKPKAKAETKVAKKVEEPTPTVEAEPAEPVAQAFPSYKTSKGYWREAVKWLQVGDEVTASAALEEALVLDPHNKIAKKLLHQINADAKAELGDKHFNHTVQEGESLSGIAKEFMNDALKFHILAKYNDIDNPSRVTVGQVLRIPGAAPKVAVAKPKPAESPVEVAYRKATKDFSKQRYKKVVAELERVLEENVEGDFDPTKVKALLISAYVKQAERFRDNGENKSAGEYLDKAADLDADNASVLTAQKQLERDVEAEAVFNDGINAMKSNDAIAAYDAFRKALKLNAQHIEAKVWLDKVKPDVVDVIYKRALQAQRRQELDKAIALWDQVLEITPDNENARLYKIKAVELRTNLQKFAAD